MVAFLGGEQEPYGGELDDPHPLPIEQVNENGYRDGGGDSECSDGQLCIRSTCVEIQKGLAECRDFRVQFGFNSVDFEASAKADLLRMARCLRADQSLRVTIEGNADERGTEEYNLQLSNRRAASVKRYLTDLGVADAALDTVGYGENKPAVQGANEAAWAANRRVELVKR